MATMYDAAGGGVPADATDILIPTDGQYAPVGAQLRQRFPHATFHTYSAVGQVPGEWVDVETGCVWPPEVAVTLWRAWRAQGCKGFYCARSTRTILQGLITPAELAVVEWFEADPTGVAHLLPGDVATQYLWGPSFDASDTTPEFEGVPATPEAPAPIPAPPPAGPAPAGPAPAGLQHTATPGPTPPQGDNMILRDPTTGGLWVVASTTGAIYAYDGAPFLGGTNSPAANPGNYPVHGICEYVDPSGVGYEIVLDWGDRGDGHSADGGDRFRRYRFPRNGSAKA